jgi:hypothetical protein
MVSAVFFHGLESSLPSSKVVTMQEEGWEVNCRQMDYKQANEYQIAEEFVLDKKPTILVGSSLGGAICKFIGTRLDIPMILLNPAIRSVEFNIGFPEELGAFRPKIWALLGMRDSVVDPIKNYELLSELDAKTYKWEHGHRTPSQTFKSFLELIRPEVELYLK